MMKSTKSAQAGLTMLEVLIASIILSMLVFMSSWLVWTSADHVTNIESSVKLESAAREVLDRMVHELHQCAAGKFARVDTTKPIPQTPAAMLLQISPGTLDSGTPPYPITTPVAVTAPFDGIRFRIAAPEMELTAVSKNLDLMTYKGPKKVDGSDASIGNKKMENTASADLNGTTDIMTGKKIYNFDLQKFKAPSPLQEERWMYEITYWWEVDTQAANGVDSSGKKGEGTVNALSPSGYGPDLIDNNKNGVVDEGVIKKMETWYNPDGSLSRRVVTIVAKDVTSLQFSVPGCPAWAKTSADVTASAYTVGSEKTIQVSITFQRPDPRFPKDSKKTVTKTVTSLVDLRNF